MALSSELQGPGTKRTRLLGEDLVLFRDARRLGLLTEQCPHRRASLAYGVVEPEGLRCAYHGWLFDSRGTCLERPAEPDSSRTSACHDAHAYRVEELGGLIFGYLGPEPAPLLPRFDAFVWDDVIRDVGQAVIPVNFLQIMENALDPLHVEWLHGRYFRYLEDCDLAEGRAASFAKRHLRLGYDRFPYGIVKRRLLEGQTEEDEDWRIGHPVVFPNMLRVGGGGSFGFHIRVPVDDTTTWHLWYTCYRPGGVPVADPGEVTSYEVPWRDDRGEFILDFIEGQDIMAWVTQGPIADRTREHLGKSDAGVVLLRRLFLEQMRLVEAGLDPIGVVRSEAENDIIELPQETDKFGAGDAFIHDFLDHAHPRYSSRRDEIKQLCREAAGRHTGDVRSGVAPAAHV